MITTSNAGSTRPYPRLTNPITTIRVAHSTKKENFTTLGGKERMESKTPTPTHQPIQSRNSREATHRAAWIMWGDIIRHLRVILLLGFVVVYGTLVLTPSALPRAERAIPHTWSYPAEVSSVTGLLSACRPAAIPGLIVAIIVDAIQCICRAFAVTTFWPAPHVGNEIGEAISPTLADNNSTGSIILISSSPRVITTIPHRAPNSKFRPHLAYAVCTVDYVHRFNNFLPKASATLRVSGNQRFGPYRFFRPAFATAQICRPHSWLPPRALNQFHYYEATECLS